MAAVSWHATVTDGSQRKNQWSVKMEEQRTTRTILVIEDDPAVGEVLLQIFRDETPYQGLLARNGRQAREISARIKPDLFVLDYHLPDTTGVDLYDYLHTVEGREDVPALFVSGCVPLDEVKKRNLVSLRKPFELDELLDAIEQTI
jgi:DNA-binding response OmpR family regulator